MNGNIQWRIIIRWFCLALYLWLEPGKSTDVVQDEVECTLVTWLYTGMGSMFRPIEQVVELFYIQMTFILSREFHQQSNTHTSTSTWV